MGTQQLKTRWSERSSRAPLVISEVSWMDVAFVTLRSILDKEFRKKSKLVSESGWMNFRVKAFESPGRQQLQ